MVIYLNESYFETNHPPYSSITILGFPIPLFKISILPLQFIFSFCVYYLFILFQTFFFFNWNMNWTLMNTVIGLVRRNGKSLPCRPFCYITTHILSPLINHFYFNLVDFFIVGIFSWLVLIWLKFKYFGQWLKYFYRQAYVWSLTCRLI